MPTFFLDSGALTARLTLQHPQDTPDGAGGAARSWTTLAIVWGKIEPVSALGRDLAGQAGQVVSHRVYLRARSGIAIGMRFVRLQRTFEIKTISDPDESGRYLVCLCEEATP